MKNINFKISNGFHSAQFILTIFTFLFFSTAYSQTISLSVSGPNNEVVGGYRWLIEEDVNQDVVPNVTCQPGNYVGCMSLEFDKSHMPVVAKGTHLTAMPDLDSTKRYFISVLPDSAGTDGGYSNGGAKISAGQTNVSVTVNQLPFPTAQIRVFVFHDNLPINNQPDTAEAGLAGFTLILEDAGGRYGISGQQIATDAYGNPLGTEYVPGTSGQIAVDAMGNQLLGDGTITTDADGIAIIKNLVPAKYGISAIPPGGDTGWIQTSTIEGKRIIDAWVKPGEPAYFAEFGPPGPHVFIGFTKQIDDTSTLIGSIRTTITGQVRSIHNSAPPNFAFHTGAPVPGCWVGLNDMSVGIGKTVFTAPCNEDSTFSIPNVPPGSYQLAVWDKNLDYIFATKNLTVDPTGTCNNGLSCNLLDVPIFAWFGRIEQYVFHDVNEDGIWNPGEEPFPEQGTALRWRDGTVYQGFPTDLSGAAPYDEVFPFFSWLVAEVEFGRFKATGATMVIDAGGPVTPGDKYDGVLNPLLQNYVNDNGITVTGSESRTSLGPVLTQGIQTFLGQTNQIMWGKKPYVIGENGGISGIVFYAITRAENDPAYAAPEPWEPGIPRIQVALYEDLDADGIIDEKNGVAGIQLADVDNYPVGNFPGTEDYDYNLDGIKDQGDAIQVTYTDSWDDAIPTGCGAGFTPDPDVSTATSQDCYDGLRNFNQIRDAVFDGGYAFDGLTPGTYIVATGEHNVYEVLKQEDRNIDFGDTYIAPNLLPPACVGDDHTIPNTFSLFDSGEPVPNAGTVVKLCDRKQVVLSDGANAAADFYFFTDVPIAGHIVGFILDDLSNEFDPNSPTFGEKYSPPYLPISIRDWKGKEILRTSSDRWGKFNALVPSTYTVNVASASGMSPNMLTACMNDPGPIDDGTGNLVIDPNYRKQYSQFCYTLNYMPGSTTYLDTPVLPVAAYTGPNQNPLDCQIQDGTPVIWSTKGSLAFGPYVDTAGQSVTLISAKDPAGIRDLGFGATTGSVYLNGVELPAASITQWDNDGITVAIPETGLLEIARADGTRTVTGIKVTVGGGALIVPPGGSIQSVIDIASPGDLILVGPGRYNEMLIMDKPVRLQGAGSSTVVSATNNPVEKLLEWRIKANSIAASGDVTLLPGQVAAGPNVNLNLEPDLFFTEEGAGIFVLAKRNGKTSFKQNISHIDGFVFTNSDHAGGIIVNGFAENLEISNNRIFTNNGTYGGGIRLGNPVLGDADNNNINIHHNYVAENGSLAATAVGGGISLYEGSDNYSVTNNYVCGNFSAGNGGGIGHLGLSEDGVIANNTIIYNQTFNQGLSVSGGGIYVGGMPVLAALTEGSGSVTISANLIQGNQAGAGDGGGIRTALVNGKDIVNKPTKNWHKIDIVNNIVVNNLAGLAGGGISLQDTYSFITNNTIVNNNSTATAGDAFNPGNPNMSVAQPAGIVSRAHSPELAAAFGTNAPPEFVGYSHPVMNNNIIMDNRSFSFEIDTTQDPALFGLVDAGIWDFGVLGVAGGTLTSNFSVMTGDATTLELFVMPYVNTGNGETIKQVELTTTIAVQPAFDEGGNFIHVNFGPLGPTGDYHLNLGTIASDAGDNSVAPDVDFDGDLRKQMTPTENIVDIGADEVE